MKVLNGTQILGTKDIVYRDVPTPELGEDTCIRVRNLTAAGRGEFVKRSLALRKKAEEESGESNPATLINLVEFELEILLIVLTAIDAEGVYCFKLDEVQALAEKNAAMVKRVASVAQEISGLMPKEKAEQVKPSAPTPS